MMLNFVFFSVNTFIELNLWSLTYKLSKLKCIFVNHNLFILKKVLYYCTCIHLYITKYINIIKNKHITKRLISTYVYTMLEES